MIRKTLKRRKMPAKARGKAESVNRSDGSCASNRVMDRLRSQRFRKCDDLCDAFRYRLTMKGGQVDLPAILLDRNKQAATAVVDGGPVQHRAPVRRVHRRYLERCGRIAQVDADFRLFGLRQADPVQKIQC